MIPGERRVVGLDLSGVVVLILRELVTAGEEQPAREPFVETDGQAVEVAVTRIARREQGGRELRVGQPLRLRGGPLASAGSG